MFSAQVLAYEPATLAAEVRQGKAVADAAKATGVKHLVYSSVGGAERHTGIDHFESKAEIERHILALDPPATVLRPVFSWTPCCTTPTPRASGSCRCPSSRTSQCS